MRKLIFLSVAAGALVAAGAAHAESGYVGVQYGNTDVEDFDSADSWGAETALALGENAFTFEFDGAVNRADGLTTTGLAGHFYTRNDSHLIGGFASYSDGNNSDWSYAFGAEANKYWSNFTLAGAVAYLGFNEEEVDGYAVSGEGRFFATENFRLQGNAQWAQISAGSVDVDATNFGASAEFKFGESPFSVGVGYNHTELDDFDLAADTVSVGLRYNWNGTLLDRDRNGPSQASLVGFGSLFNF